MIRGRCGWLMVILVLTLLAPALQHPGSARESGNAQTCDTLAVATAPLTPGSPMTENEVVLIRPDGSQVMSVPFEQPMQVWPASLDGRALVRSLDGDYGGLNLDAGTVSILQLPGSEQGAIDPNSYQFSESRAQRFHLLGDAAKLTGYLIDLQPEESLSLNDLLESPELVVIGVVSADDHWLAFFTGSQSYLVDLTAIKPAVALEEDLRAGNPLFTSDGRSLIYLRETGQQLSGLVLWDLESDDRRVIAPAAEWSGARMLPGDILCNAARPPPC